MRPGTPAFGDSERLSSVVLSIKYAVVIERVAPCWVVKLKQAIISCSGDGPLFASAFTHNYGPSFMEVLSAKSYFIKQES
jgi:hypothetical protein